MQLMARRLKPLLQRSPRAILSEGPRVRDGQQRNRKAQARDASGALMLPNLPAPLGSV